jgi:hypothetical protein
MNSFAKEVGKRPRAALAQIGRDAFFCAVVSFFGERIEKIDCFHNAP